MPARAIAEETGRSEKSVFVIFGRAGMTRKTRNECREDLISKHGRSRISEIIRRYRRGDSELRPCSGELRLLKLRHTLLFGDMELLFPSAK